METEFGIYEMEPGEVILIPGGISHRSIGRDDSLRYFCRSHEAVDYVMGEDQYTSHTTFVVKRIGGPDWTARRRLIDRQRSSDREDAFLG